MSHEYALAKKRTITACHLTLPPSHPANLSFSFLLPRSGYIVAGATSFLVGQLGLPFAEFITVAGAVIAQDMTETTHAPAIMAAVGANVSDIKDIISPSAVGAIVLLAFHHVFGIVKEKAKLD